jgi:hypothetical protein
MLRRHTFNCGIIFINKVTLDQLNGQAGLSDTTATYNDELILSQELFHVEG